MKTCNKCNIKKPFDDFFKRSKDPIKYYTYCKECKKENMYKNMDKYKQDPNYVEDKKKKRKILKKRKNVKIIMFEAKKEYSKGNYNEAILKWEEVLKIDSNNQQAKEYIIRVETKLFKDIKIYLDTELDKSSYNQINISELLKIGRAHV